MSKEADNLIQWRDSGDAHRWVWGRTGKWGHADWTGLLEALRNGPFWPMTEADIGRTLEEVKQLYLDLQRWKLVGDQAALQAVKPSPRDREAEIAGHQAQSVNLQSLVDRVAELEGQLEQMQADKDAEKEDYEGLLDYYEETFSIAIAKLRDEISRLVKENQLQAFDNLSQKLEAATARLPVVKPQPQKSGRGFMETVMAIMEGISGETTCRGCTKRIPVFARRCPYCTEYQQ